MSNAETTQSKNFWDWDFFAPEPTQDSKLLEEIGFLPGLKELLMVRQVHALEHATVWVLGETLGDSYMDAIAGMSTEDGFYLYGKLNINQISQATYSALERLKEGEWNLAVHPRCGTNFSVQILLTTAMVGLTSLVAPKNPLAQILGMGVAATTALEIAPDLGNSVQKYITTSIPFNLKIVNIEQIPDMWGTSAHFVRLSWENLQ